VAISVDDVKAQGIPESGISPTNPREMLYQIDGFHELHCLVCVPNPRLPTYYTGADTERVGLAATSPSASWHCGPN